jgi:hypothetical protein
MSTNETIVTERWTHRAYFRRFALNVEQYGEILVAHVFRGTKKGDSQPCYDVEASGQNVHAELLSSGTPSTAVESCLSVLENDTVRIEVKSKVAYTSASRATVIHCSDKKLNGVRHHLAATHFAVIIFDGEGNGIAKGAWLFSAAVADQLRQKETKSRYIPVSKLKEKAAQGMDGLIDIRSLINGAATSPLSIDN